MKRIVYYLITIILLLSLNMAWPSFRSAMPNFLFLFVIFTALNKDDSEYIWVALFSGLLLDINSHVLFGSYLISLTVIAWGINYATRIFFKKDISIPFMIFIVVFSYLLLTGLLYLFGTLSQQFNSVGYVLPLVYLRQKIWLDLLLNLIFAAPVNFLTGFLERSILKAGDGA